MLRGQQRAHSKPVAQHNKSQRLTKSKKVTKKLQTKKSILSSQGGFMSSTTQQRPQFQQNHEIGFDQSIKQLHKRLQDGEDPQNVIQEQNKSTIGLTPREWTVRDTLSIMPHFLQMIEPQGVFVRLAQHRMNNLRAQLRAREQEALEKKRIELDDNDGLYVDHKMHREKWLQENTIDMIPVDDIVRVQMQILLSATQYVLLSYQQYCKNTFSLQHDHDMSNTPMSQRVLDVLLDQMETVPHLTFYRLHYQQALIAMTETLASTHFKQHEVYEQVEKLDTNAMRQIFVARSYFAQSTGFKEALKAGFKQAGVLTDSTMLPLNDPLNQVKQAVLHNVIANAHTALSQTHGISVPLGHLLLETELSMGVRFTKLPKHILHVKNYYNMCKIAKMPQNPMIQKQFIDLAGLLETGIDVVGDQDNYKPNATSVSFVNNLVELDLDFPEELWLVPVDRDQRSEYFNKNPEAHAMWLIYSKLVNEIESTRGYLQQIEKCDFELKSLKEQQINADNTSLQQIDERIDVLTKGMNQMNEKVQTLEGAIMELQLQYKSKARLFRKNNPDIQWDEEEEEQEQESEENNKQQ